MSRWSIFALLLFILAADISNGEAADKWVSVRSQNFQLVGNTTEGRLRQVARDLEEFRTAFKLIFTGVGEKSSIGTTVIVFKDDAAFKPFKPLYEGKPANISGYFQSGPDVNFIAMDGEIDTPSIIYHEFVHSLTKDATQRLPTWVSEGLAEFYSTFRAEASGKAVDLGRPVVRHIQTLREKPLIPLETFLNVDQRSPLYNEQSKQGIFYAESWALVHYLVAGSEGGRRKPQFSKYLALLSDGKSVDQSFQEAFQTDYDGIEKELRDYMRAQLAWPFFKVPLPEKLDVDKSLQSAPIPTAQSEYYLGDMLMHIRRYDDAEKELQKALTLDPGFRDTYASMGMLRMHQDKNEEALQFMAKAVESDSKNHMAHFYYAELLQRLAAQDAEKDKRPRLQLMRTHLKKSIEIAPEFTPAYGWLGYVALSLHDELTETESALGRALKVAPGNEDLRFRLAEVMAANKKEAAARVILTNLQNTSSDEFMRSRASNLIQNINARLESAAAMREYEERRRAAGINPEPVAGESTSDAPPTISRSPNAPAEPGSTVYVVPTAQQPKGPQVDGFLTAIDCAKGMDLQVRVGNGMVRLHTDTPSSIDFVSYVTTIKDSIGCGPVKPELHVVVTYKRSADPAFLGIPLVVEFRP